MFSIRFRVFLKLTFVLLFLYSCNKENEKDDQANQTEFNPSSEIADDVIFQKIPSSQSNITFANNLKEDLTGLSNLFDFDYFYNGAGAAVADFNNDGLEDIFFCGNQVENKLYLNKGNLTFEDISATAGINKGKIWSNAATVVDINEDGWKDIYISQGGPNQRLQRKNLLFINNQDNTFSEAAEAYGLADMGISTHTAFFDFDKDGDLDCLVMNENELYGVDPYNLNRMISQNPETKYFNSSHFYRNDNGKFKDITCEAGLERPIFGLGLCISDINNDNWLDIYIASDYYIPDAVFINNGNGTFTDKIKGMTSQVSFYGMGLDISDINNDRLQDIFVLDMASQDHVRSKTLMASMDTQKFSYLVDSLDYHHQYMYNSFQLNMGNNQFSNVAQLTNTANTDWSWSVLAYDFDLNGLKDIFVTNGYRRYALDNDLQQKVIKAKQDYRGRVPLDVKQQLYNSMPSEQLRNILYSNQGDLNFEDRAAQWGLTDYSFSNGAVVADLDNDGDLDIIVNNIDQEAFIYKNTTRDKNEKNYLQVKIAGYESQNFPKVSIFYDQKTQFEELKVVRGYRSSQPALVHFGLGMHKKIDSLKIEWLDGTTLVKENVPANQVVFIDKKKEKSRRSKEIKQPTYFEKIPSEELNIHYSHQENIYDDFQSEVLLPYKQSNFGPYISKGDINKDGLMDFYVGGAAGQPGEIFIQDGSKFQKKSIPAFEKDKHFEDMESAFFDFDKDGDMDLFVVSGGNEFPANHENYKDRLYLNDGKGNFTRFDSKALNANSKSGKTVSILDMDNDGDQDIIIGNRIIPKKYPIPESSIVYENIGGELQDVTQQRAPGLNDFGIINSILATDYNNDGWTDFIAVGEWTGIGLFENRNGKFQLVQNEKLEDLKGWWFSVQETDVDNDGKKDYLLGNVGLNLKFKASAEKPFKIYANDFDNNGSNDIVLSKKYHSEYVPVRGRECSSQQMPFLKEKFPTYSEFANANLKDIYGEGLDTSYEKEATEFRSILLRNLGSGKFEVSILPVEAQMFPVFKTIFVDLNNDGFDDAVLAGNIYETEVETPRLDAISGLVLLSNGKDNYTALPYQQSNLYLKGNVKDIHKIEMKDREILMGTSNNSNLKTYIINKNL